MSAAQRQRLSKSARRLRKEREAQDEASGTAEAFTMQTAKQWRDGGRGFSGNRMRPRFSIT
jgi:hypothetical protein